MGGVKKKSLASMEKSQDSSEGAQGQGQAQPQKGKKTEKKAAPPQQKRLAFLPPKMSDAELLKTLTPLKAITIYSASRALGVNAAVASGVLRSLEGKSMIVKAGGFSGHYVWSLPQKQ